jgi:hypothetical protein
LATGDFLDNTVHLTKIGREIRETGEAIKSEELKPERRRLTNIQKTKCEEGRSVAG